MLADGKSGLGYIASASGDRLAEALAAMDALAASLTPEELFASGFSSTHPVASCQARASRVAPTNIPMIPPVAMPPSAPTRMTGIGTSTPRPSISGLSTLSAMPETSRSTV